MQVKIFKHSRRWERSGQENSASLPKGGGALVYRFSTQEEIAGVYLHIEETSNEGGDWATEWLRATPVLVRKYTFTAAANGETSTGEAFVHGKPYTIGEAGKAAYGGNLPVFGELPAEEDEVFFSFEFPDEKVTVVDYHSYVLYDVFTLAELDRCEVNPTVIPGVVYAESDENSRTVYHTEKSAVATPKKYAQILVESEGGEPIEFANVNRGQWATRQLVIEGEVWDETDGHLGVRIAKKKNAGGGRDSFTIFSLTVPSGSIVFEKWSDEEL